MAKHTFRKKQKTLNLSSLKVVYKQVSEVTKKILAILNLRLTMCENTEAQGLTRGDLVLS